MVKGKDPFIEEYVKPGIKNCIEQVARDATEEFLVDLRIKIKNELGRIAVKLATHFDVKRAHNRIIITFKEESARDDKKRI